MKRAGGRRFYRPQDILVLAAIRKLLHVDGYTIKGVQKLHKEHGLKRLLDAPASSPAPPPAFDDDLFTPLSDAGLTTEARQRLETALQDLEAAKARLDHLLRGG